jgi:hypothetical protein
MLPGVTLLWQILINQNTRICKKEERRASLHHETSSHLNLRHWNPDDNFDFSFLTDVSKGKISCSSIKDIVRYRVSIEKRRNFSTFVLGNASRHDASTRWSTAADTMCRILDVCMFSVKALLPLMIFLSFSTLFSSLLLITCFLSCMFYGFSYSIIELMVIFVLWN